MLRPRHIGLIIILLILILVIYVTRSTTGGGGSGGAPTDAQYVTLATNATLTQERVLTGTTNQVTVTDNGAGSTVVLSLPQDIDTDADVTFGTGTFNSPADATSAAIIAQNSVDAASNLILQLQGPDRVTPTTGDTIFWSFLQDMTAGFAEVARIESFVGNPGGAGIGESAVRFRVLDNGSLQLSMILENDDIALTRNGGSYRLRSTDGITVDVSASAQTAATTVFLTIPDVGDTSDVFVLQDAIQTITGKTLDGDDNTFVDISPDSFDNLDSPVDGECATYNTGQIEWVACGGSGIDENTFFRSHDDIFTGGELDELLSVAACLNNCTPQTSTSFTPGANDLQAWPIYITNSGTFGSIVTYVSTADGVTTSGRVGIYEAAADSTFLYPGDLIEDYGTFSVATTGKKVIACTTCVAFQPGMYFLTIIVESSSAGFRVVSDGSANGIYWGNTDSSNINVTGLEDDGTSICSGGCGTLPDPFTTTNLIQASTNGTLWIAVTVN